MLTAGWCDGKDFWRLCVSAAVLTLGTTTFVVPKSRGLDW